ncbi:MAG TPA: hypothetical protein VLG37_04110 [Candidatus Saccharimonadales bacterium]|nr:hypothetical protein [Candidatus Saccharimonadales bacterium]
MAKDKLIQIEPATPSWWQTTKPMVLKPEFISAFIVVAFAVFGVWYRLESHKPSDHVAAQSKSTAPAVDQLQVLTAPPSGINLGTSLQPAGQPANSNDPELSTGLDTSKGASIGPAPTNSTSILQSGGRNTQQTRTGIQ